MEGVIWCQNHMLVAILVTRWPKRCSCVLFTLPLGLFFFSSDGLSSPNVLCVLVFIFSDRWVFWSFLSLPDRWSIVVFGGLFFSSIEFGCSGSFLFVLCRQRCSTPSSSSLYFLRVAISPYRSDKRNAAAFHHRCRGSPLLPQSLCCWTLPLSLFRFVCFNCFRCCCHSFCLVIGLVFGFD